MTPAQLHEAIRAKRSLLCVGLDPDLSRIPQHIRSLPQPLWEFCRRIIDTTAHHAIAYKPNTAFFEAHGPAGWDQLAKVAEYLPTDTLRIADCKRGDIGNTSTQYARAFFDHMPFDAVTVAPYMGADSVIPFLQFPGKWVFLLALTSNPGAEDFQWHGPHGQPLYQQVIRKSQAWAADQPGHLGYVTGATRPEYLRDIRSLAPQAFLLVPGVGAQGGDLQAVLQHGLTPQGGLLINASRQILYASPGEDFAQAAKHEAQKLQEACAAFL